MKVKPGKDLLDEWTKKYKKEQKEKEDENVKKTHEEEPESKGHYVDDWFGEK
jgi:hypothetical protein